MVRRARRPARRVRRAPSRCARAHPGATQPGWIRRRLAARWDAGTGTAAGSPVPWTRSRLSSSSTAASADDSVMPPAAAASSGSNGSPATAAPSSARRASSPRSASSSARSAATGAGTSRPRTARRPGTTGRAARGRTGCRRSPRTAPAPSPRRPVVQELPSLGCVSATDLDPSQHAGAVRALERGGEPAGRLPGPERGCDEDGSVGRAPEEGAEELDRTPESAQWRSSSEEHERRRGREPLEQVAHRGVHAVAVVLEHRVARLPAARFSDGRISASVSRVPSSSASRPCGSSPRTCSSSASTKTQKGRSRSSSDAAPRRTRYPCASARAAASASRRVLPMPGSPMSASAPAVVREPGRGATRRRRCTSRRAQRGARPCGPCRLSAA